MQRRLRVEASGSQISPHLSEGQPLADAAPNDPERIRIAQQLNFGVATPPGKYLIEVTVFDKLAGKTEGAVGS